VKKIPSYLNGSSGLSRLREIAVAHWLEYVGFRNGEELEAAINMFEDHHLGHFESIERTQPTT
jgi:hypothetical protein